MLVLKIVRSLVFIKVFLIYVRNSNTKINRLTYCNQHLLGTSTFLKQKINSSKQTQLQHKFSKTKITTDNIISKLWHSQKPVDDDAGRLVYNRYTPVTSTSSPGRAASTRSSAKTLPFERGTRPGGTLPGDSWRFQR